MRKLLLTGVTTILVAAVGTVVAVALVGAIDRPTERTILRDCAPSLDEQKAELQHLEAESDSFGVVPTGGCTADTSALRQHGPFRIVPGGYAGELSYKTVSTPPAPSARAETLAEVRSSPLYRVPDYVPAGFVETLGDTFDGDLGTVVRVRYEAPGREFELIRTLRNELPRDVYVADPNDPSTALAIDLTYVGGCPAFTFSPKSGSSTRIAFASVTFLCDEVETTLRSGTESVDELLIVAASVQEGEAQ